MDPRIITDDIQALFNQNIIRTLPISAGKQTSGYAVEFENHQRYFIKCSDEEKGREMLIAEQEGLLALKTVEHDHVPTIIRDHFVEERSYLVLEYIQEAFGSSEDDEALGKMIAKLHSSHSTTYGWEKDNYIASLDQKNTPSESWSVFLINNRLAPQVKLAIDNGLLTIEDRERFQNLFEAIELDSTEHHAVLCHGDLWNGNAMITANGPFLIDPAVSYLSRYMDLAMMDLFGGFAPVTLEAYYRILPKAENHSDQIAMCQLYFLLNHLNLFGPAYLKGIRNRLDLLSA